MTRLNRKSLIIILIGIVILGYIWSDRSQQKVDNVIYKAGGLEYIHKTLGGAEASEKLPMIIAIHGLGGTPEGLASLYENFDYRARLIMPMAPNEKRLWFSIDVSIDTMEKEIKKSADLINGLSNILVEKYPTLGKPIITGFSQGGFLSFASAIYHGEDYSSILPISGAYPGDIPAVRKRVPRIPIKAFHGIEDDVVLYSWGLNTIEQMRNKGWDIDLISYRGLGHSISPDMKHDYYSNLKNMLANLE